MNGPTRPNEMAAPRLDAEALLETLQREKRISDALVQVAEQAGESLELREVLDRICRLTVELIGCDRCTMFLWSRRYGAYVPFADHGSPPHMTAVFAEKRYVGEKSWEPVLQEGRPVAFSRDDYRHADELETLHEAEAYAIAMFPLSARHRRLGTMSLTLASPPSFGETSLKIARGISRQAATLIDNSQLFRSAERTAAVRAGLAGLAAAAGRENDAATIAQLVRAEGDPYQIALVDLNMPQMDGEMLARRIKADPEVRDTVLLLLTSSGQVGDARRMAEAGFAAYLTKPVRPSVLMDALQTAWAGREPASEAVLITRHGTRAKGTPARPPAREDTGIANARVLLVEDNSVNQKVGRLTFEKLGCHIDVAGDGCEAVEMVGRVRYDIVFMDCQMPVMDGYEATREIRRRQSDTARIPIVAMTAHAMTGDREKCLSAGMDDDVPKPILHETVREALARWVHGPTVNLDPAPVALGE